MAVHRPLPTEVNLNSHNSSTSRWQSNSDFHLRKGMIYIIKKLMKSKSGNQLSKTKLILLKHIELNLYTTSSSMEEYADISTLKLRMVEAVKRLIQVSKEHIETSA
ncbi:hypothetical protein CTEN210_16018 [Chaetoceros tenuissimus]|uniref:Uncharacterized protein n=1 Tax=Chaetoceros tenuissimus TaxID=426638 RepID=A0AAD3D8T9_9STRA|nr:hypothetical protein CTEN210_16018 [Chaetoceros tenuissimus]